MPAGFNVSVSTHNPGVAVERWQKLRGSGPPRTGRIGSRLAVSGEEWGEQTPRFLDLVGPDEQGLITGENILIDGGYSTI